MTNKEYKKAIKCIDKIKGLDKLSKKAIVPLLDELVDLLYLVSERDEDAIVSDEAKKTHLKSSIPKNQRDYVSEIIPNKNPENQFVMTKQDSQRLDAAREMRG